MNSLHPFFFGLGASLLIVVCSYLLPEAFVTDALAFLFIALGYLYVTRAWDEERVARGALTSARIEKRLKSSGLLFGGLLSPEPLKWSKVMLRLLNATWSASWLFFCIALPYSLAFFFYFQPSSSFSFSNAWRGPDAALFTFGPSQKFLELALAHLMVIALPEEFFLRGALQPALIRRWGPGFRIWGGSLGWANLVVSLIFALGHFLTTFDLTRLSVFFPSLLFGWLASRKGSISSSVILHAQCNLLVVWLNQGWFGT